MTQKQLIGLAITGIKQQQIALTKGIMENREKPYVMEGLEKALRDTFPIRRELEEMMEAELKKEQPDMFGWVNETLAGLTIRRA